MNYQDSLSQLRRNIESVLLGKGNAIRQTLVALLAKGHVLLEDVPGVGKTVLTRALARSIFADARPGYHALSRRVIESVMEKYDG